LTAALTELEPTGNRRKAALVATVATAGGLGLGPVVAGLLAQYAPAPHVLPFVLEIVLLVPVAATIVSLPATRTAGRWRPRRPEIPSDMRSQFATSGTASFLAFAVIGVFLTPIPTYVANLSGSNNLLLGAGAGQGLVYLGGLTTINQTAPADRHADVLSSFYGIMYLGVGLPVIGVGILAALAGLLASVQYFAGIVAVLCVGVLFILARAHPRTVGR
jgi:MFS family permease